MSAAVEGTAAASVGAFAITTLGLTGYAHMTTSCMRGVFHRATETPALIRNAFASPSDTLQLPASSSPDLLGTCKVNSNPSTSTPAAAWGELLFVGEGAHELSSPTLALAGAQIRIDGKSVMVIHGRDQDLQLTFQTQDEASAWAKELACFTKAKAVPLRLKELLVELDAERRQKTDMQDHINDLKKEVDRLQLSVHNTKMEASELTDELKVAKESSQRLKRRAENHQKRNLVDEAGSSCVQKLWDTVGNLQTALSTGLEKKRQSESQHGCGANGGGAPVMEEIVHLQANSAEQAREITDLKEKIALNEARVKAAADMVEQKKATETGLEEKLEEETKKVEVLTNRCEASQKVSDDLRRQLIEARKKAEVAITSEKQCKIDGEAAIAAAEQAKDEYAKEVASLLEQLEMLQQQQQQRELQASAAVAVAAADAVPGASVAQQKAAVEEAEMEQKSMPQSPNKEDTLASTSRGASLNEEPGSRSDEMRQLQAQAAAAAAMAAAVHVNQALTPIPAPAAAMQQMAAPPMQQKPMMQGTPVWATTLPTPMEPMPVTSGSMQITPVDRLGMSYPMLPTAIVAPQPSSSSSMCPQLGTAYPSAYAAPGPLLQSLPLHTTVLPIMNVPAPTLSGRSANGGAPFAPRAPMYGGMQTQASPKKTPYRY